MALAPVTIFTYNRVEHTRQTVEALKKNSYASESELVVFSDYAKNESETEKVNAVRKYLKSISGFKNIRIVERERNYGLAVNIIEGVSDVINEYGKIIVLEDDLLTSPFFLKYMNEALDLYEKHDQVISIHGYIYPVTDPVSETFFLIDPGSLGWGTWKNRWSEYERDGSKLLRKIEEGNLAKEFNYDNSYPFLDMLKNQVEGRNSSWVIRWYGQAILQRKLTLYPARSLVFHNGNDGSGTHEGSSDVLDVELSDRPIKVELVPIEISTAGRNAFKNYFKRVHPHLLGKIIRKIRKIFAA